MRWRWLLILPLVLLLVGCSTVSSRRLNSLETKVNTLEAKVDSVKERQSATESQTGESSAIVTSQENQGSVYESGKASLTKKDIQQALKNAGYYDGAIDGKIGKNTKKAIMEFQKANGLKADRVVGPKTKSLLLQYLTVKAQ